MLWLYRSPASFVIAFSNLDPARRWLHHSINEEIRYHSAADPDRKSSELQSRLAYLLNTSNKDADIKKDWSFGGKV